MEFSANKHMRRVLGLANQAASEGEVPVAALMIDENSNIIAEAYNQTIVEKNSLRHAEMIVLQKAYEFYVNDKDAKSRLENCTLFVNLEPCIMCAGAIANARIKNLYYAAPDEKSGAVENGVRVFASKSCHHKPNIFSGIMENESRQLLQSFFSSLR